MISLTCQDASKWHGNADIVFTNPYAPIPNCLHGKPCIINMYEQIKDRRHRAEVWVGCKLEVIGSWGAKQAHLNRVYAGNIPARSLDFSDIDDVGIWFPEELVRRVIHQYRDFFVPGATVWDGFMGRGTVGKFCRFMGMNFVGMDIDPDRVRFAKKYVFEDE